eukprot:TRINITY_DN104817_c0_g1_i1.p1 TRINITY_DN104817_c0_g1~~TRINITY_DN104817_c0_g1_i1.p1  ORF type:complete len:536 (+),score=96.91 TRINITY_DN104817_c0_g1_i1:74-1681(+)
MGPTKKSFAGNAGRKRPALWAGGTKSAGGFRAGRNRDDGSGAGDAAGARREAGDRGGGKSSFRSRRKNDGDSGQQGNWSGRGGSSSARNQGRQSSWKSEGKKASGDKAPWLAKETKEGKKGPQTRDGRKHPRPKQMRIRGQGGQRTGANEIEVDWKPPGAEDETPERDQPHGVTPKSGMPRKPSPSPVRGPAGRGAPIPAWKKKNEGAQLALPAPSIPGEAAENPASDRADSPVRGPAGRGRSEVKPAWMTRQEGNKEATPSIPIEDDRASDNHDNDERGRRSSRASRSRSGQHRKSWGGGGGSKGGREDSNWWEENDWNSGNHWRDYRGRHSKTSWKDDWRRGGNWPQDDDKGSWKTYKERGSTYSSSSTSKAYADNDSKDWDRDDQLLCVTHGKRRSWDQLEGNKDGEWVCIRSCPCVVYVDGPKGTQDLAAALEEWKRIVAAVEDVENGRRRVFERGDSSAKDRKDAAEAKDQPRESRNGRSEDGTATKHETASAPREPEKEASPPVSRRKVFLEKEKASAGDANGIDQDDL